VAEICEYDRSFLDIYPYILILTNIEEEHLDTFPGGISEIKAAFLEYVRHVRDDGTIIACADDHNVKEVLDGSGIRAKVEWYGSGSNYNQLDVSLAIPGHHNVLNALGVTALADQLKIERSVSNKVLQNYKGAHRRFELKGEYNGSPVVDDYGHHPTEIKATIAALSERYPDRRKVVVFWPHQYKRMQPLLEQFSQAFSGADELIVKPIYLVPGRDEVLPVSSEDLVNLINQRKNIAKVMGEDDEIIEYIKGRLDNRSVLLTIGIPPVYKIADGLLGLNQ
jgi:UDP-N-acetylmuramate--alanine ligase